ncbi:hypothetical protein TIFTF001_003878 [Ficus carica]|uniref:Uncharacterized protein n=1 Tax=Ficus carica TaxID=3494 RepID=A0AA87ZDQ6_FICCA|nr:hypothetical protein TIFTF001_003878 [Ficus carica]
MLLMMVMVGQYSCDASSRMLINGDHQVFNTKPKSSDHDHQVVSGHFLDFLPKGIPIPSSGPSRKHNDIGLQSYSTSSSSP